MTDSLASAVRSLRRALRARTRSRLTDNFCRAETLEVRQLLSANLPHDDHRLAVDAIPAFVDAAAASAAPQAAPPYHLSQTFLLNSLPGASQTIYLDFDGHVTTGTWWNSSRSMPTITTPAFSLEGDASFSDFELERIQRIWQRVAEDFAPFHINVTTQDYGVSAITKSGSGDTTFGVRVIIGGSSMDWYGSSAGGVAYYDTYGSSTDMGVFVFSISQFNGEKAIAEAASHEVGHSLGLVHDGQGATAYYAGHGGGPTGWAPIMGVGYSQELTQWSKGEYPNANATQDDLAVITSARNGVTYRVDDYGSSRETASVLVTTGAGSEKLVDVAGLIERNTDQDWFSFTSTGGLVDLTISGIASGSNIDLAALIYNADGQLVYESNPADLAHATISTILAPGDYTLMIDGVGARGLADGYSDYASLGQYFIRGAIGRIVEPPPAGTSSVSGRVWHDADGDGKVEAGEFGFAGVRVYDDSNNNGVHDPATERSTLTDVDGRYTLTGLAAGSRRIRQVAPAGFTQIDPKANAARTASLRAGRTLANINFRNLLPPTLGNLGGSVTYAAQSAAILLTDSATVSDADTSLFTGFKLTAQITSGSNSADRLSILNQGRAVGQVGVSGTSIYYSGVKVATMSGGSGAAKLTITFNNKATLAAVQVILRSMTYRSTATTLAPGTRTVTFLLTEPKGAASAAVTRQILIVA
ncbi:MAG TPA: SdrD B-like domain-containing protein [Caulifigura sp.]|nr:SdrD B-like domain-containing protein [Caulifigura sp.]